MVPMSDGIGGRSARRRAARLGDLGSSDRAHRRGTSRWPGVAMGLCLAAAACGDDGATPSPAADGGSPEPTTAVLSFSPRLAAEPGAQLDPSWRTGVPGFEGDPVFVVMLCAPDDATCVTPAWVHEVTPEEHSRTPMSATAGPMIRIEGVPTGTYVMMLLADSRASRDLGFAYDDEFATSEEAWGGHASEADLLLSGSGDVPTVGHNPGPVVVPISLSAGEQEDLGPLFLGHFHERSVSPEAMHEAAILTLAVDGGVRRIDLRTHTVLPTAAGTDSYTQPMVDADGAPVMGAVCGLVQASAGRMLVLYRTGAGGGFAIPFDAVSGQQIGDGARVIFPPLPDGPGPCRGIFHSDGARELLYVANADANPTAAAAAGLWFADVTHLADGDVAAGSVIDVVTALGVDGLAADGDTLAVTVTPGVDEITAPASARGRHLAVLGHIGGDGRPTLTDPDTFAWDYVIGPLAGSGLESAEGSIECTSGLDHGGVAIASFADEAGGHRPLVFIGGCLETTVVDLRSREVIDYNGSLPGAPGIDGSLFGQGFSTFVASPDGTTLWAIPQAPSPVPFYMAHGAGADRQRFPRHMAMPLSLSGERPAVRPEFTDGNIDDFSVPEDDPGVDLSYGGHLAYLLRWAPALADHTFAEVVATAGVSAAVGRNTLFLRGAAVTGGAAGLDGLGKGGGLATYDLASRQAILWPRGGQPFYGMFTGGPTVTPRFGFDLLPEGGPSLAVHGIAYTGVE